MDIHPPPSSSTNGASGQRVESNGDDGRDSDLYELIPSEKEFGTLGNARPVLRGVSHFSSSKNLFKKYKKKLKYLHK